MTIGVNLPEAILMIKQAGDLAITPGSLAIQPEVRGMSLPLREDFRLDVDGKMGMNHGWLPFRHAGR